MNSHFLLERQIGRQAFLKDHRHYKDTISPSTTKNLQQAAIMLPAILAPITVAAGPGTGPKTPGHVTSPTIQNSNIRIIKPQVAY